jgi:hypothetical protein
MLFETSRRASPRHAPVLPHRRRVLLHLRCDAPPSLPRCFSIAMQSNAELQQAAEEAIAAAEAATAQAREAIARAEAANQCLAEYENTMQSRFHAEAVAVINIKMMIPLVLEQTSTFYSRWRSLFLNTVTKYALDCLVLTDDDFSTDPHWHRMDCTIKSWLFGMVAPDLIEAMSTTS